MNNLIIKPVNKNIGIKKFNHKTRAIFKNKKLVQYLLMLSEFKRAKVITSYSGTILFDKELSFQKVWTEVYEQVSTLRKLLVHFTNLCELLVVIEVHRSNKKGKVFNNTLVNRPHIHFVCSFANTKLLGPDISQIRQILNNSFYDVNFKLINNNVKDMLQVYRYLLKDLPVDDVNMFLQKIYNIGYTAFWFGFSGLMIDYLQSAQQEFDKNFKEKIHWSLEYNPECFHVSEDCHPGSVFEWIVKQYMNKLGHIVIQNGVLSKVKGLQYTYDYLMSHDEYRKYLKKHLKVHNIELKEVLSKILTSKRSIDWLEYISMEEIQHRYIEFEDVIYDIHTDKCIEKEAYDIEENGIIRAYSHDEYDDRPCNLLDEVFRVNGITEEEQITGIKILLGSLLHPVKKHERLKIPCFVGVPGAGKTVLCKMISDLFGKENVGRGVTSKSFTLQNIESKYFIVFNEFDIKFMPLNDFKSLTSFDDLELDRKNRSSFEVPKRKIIINSQYDISKTGNYLDEKALKRRLEIIYLKETISKEKVVELLQYKPWIWTDVNRMYCQWKKA